MTLRSIITNPHEEPYFKVCEIKGSSMKPAIKINSVKEITPESKYLDATITALVNSRNGYVIKTKKWTQQFLTRSPSNGMEGPNSESMVS